MRSKGEASIRLRRSGKCAVFMYIPWRVFSAVFTGNCICSEFLLIYFEARCHRSKILSLNLCPLLKNADVQSFTIENLDKNYIILFHC